MKKKKFLFTGLGLLIALSGIFLAAFNHSQEEKDLKQLPPFTNWPRTEILKEQKNIWMKSIFIPWILTSFQCRIMMSGCFPFFCSLYPDWLL
ncbi:hypothetical protein SC499_25120 [Peribacillus simplex]|uniref:hypothetical protein n=1 Tax=Peribacillus simplex TaxID=1478 RepID=UPI00298E332F|nr:hypothetical protein [Peribacillus simplex]MDW7617859.1 hypothetical protein [Peribacillus simplex]